MITLTHIDLAMASILVLILALLSRYLHVGLEKQLLVAALRTVVQLFLIGLVLKSLFELQAFIWVLLMSLVMLAIAGREVKARQKYRLSGFWGYGVGALSMFLSSFTITLFAIAVVIQPDPWYTPQYAIPLLGMLLGNTMNGIAISLDRLNQGMRDKRLQIEARLLMGHQWQDAMSEIRNESLKSGLIPIINAMSTAGLVSLPGMMTGQILSGTEPVEAVKYQVLIMLLIGAGTGFGSFTAIWVSSHRLFDDRHRLRLDRLS